MVIQSPPLLPLLGPWFSGIVMRNIFPPKGKNVNKIDMALKMFTKTIAQLTWVLFSSIKIANSYFFSGILKSRASSDKDGLLHFSKHSTALLFFLKILKSKI